LGNGNTQESGLRNGSSVAVVLQEVDDQREDDSSKSSKRKKKKSRGNGMRSTWMDFRMRRRSAGSSSSSSSRRRWWLVLLLLLPVCGCLLVIMEMTMILSPSHWNSSSLVVLPSAKDKQEHTAGKEGSMVEEKESTLNRLDMPTRMVAGVRQACLQLLPEPELEQLQLPAPTVSPIKELHYVVDHQRFAGEPTMLQRSTTFQVQEIMNVHCGWCSGENSGFDIDAVDKAFMETCRVVILTCTFGGGDDLYQPIGYTNATAAKVCFVALWDEVTQQSQEKAGKLLGPDRTIGLWRIVLVYNLPFADQRRNGKVPKMLSHRLFPNAQYSIWVDSKSQFRRDPMGVLEALLWKPGATFAISLHGGRSCVYKEGNAIVKKNKATPEEVAIQLDTYRSEGMPENALFDGHKALAEASVIVREHTTLTNLFMCAWFNEVMRFTARDQLSFPYVLTRLNTLHPNMFHVCTRRALVNSLGHAHKAPPLWLDG